MPQGSPAIHHNDGGAPFFPEPGALPFSATPAPAPVPRYYGPPQPTQGIAPEGDARPMFQHELDAAMDRTTPVMGTLDGPDPYGAHPTPLVPAPAPPPVADVNAPFDPGAHFILGQGATQDALGGVVTPAETVTAAAAPRPKVRLGLIVGVTIAALLAAAIAGFLVVRSAGPSADSETAPATSASAKSKRKKTTPAASASGPHAVGTFRPRPPRPTPPPPATHDSPPMDPPDDEEDAPVPTATPTDQPRPYPH